MDTIERVMRAMTHVNIGATQCPLFPGTLCLREIASRPTLKGSIAAMLALAMASPAFSQVNAPTSVAPAASAADSSTAQQQRVEITGQAVKGYAAKDASVGTKTDTPIRDVPQSIEVRTRQMLDDLGGAQSSFEVAKTVAGVFNTTNGYGDPGRNVPSFNMRGYSNIGGYLRDGHVINGWMSTIDMSYIDRVEFLKGTTSALYGGSTYGGSIGGMVNYVSKVPQPIPLSVVDLTAGSDDFYRTTIDYGTPLGTSSSTWFRINGALETGRSFRDFADHDTQAIAPGLTFKLSSDDTLTLLGTTVHSSEVPALGLPMTPESFGIASSKNFIDPGFNRNQFRVGELTALYRHGFGENWYLDGALFQNRSRTTNYDGHLSYVAGGGSTLDGDLWKFAEDQSEIDLRLNGKFATGSVQHQMLLGYNAKRSKYAASEAFGGGGAPSIALTGDTLAEILLPPSGSLKELFDASATSEGTYRQTDTSRAFYVQDLLTVLPTVKLLLGARYDRYDIETVGEGAFGPFSQTNPNSHTSPRLGVVFQPNQSTSLYAVSAQSFTPNGGRISNNAVPPPELGQLRELGWKQELGKDLSLHVAAYVLTRRNQIFCDPNDPTCTFVIVAGETRSRGVELDFNGQLSSALRINVAASVMKGYISEGEPGGSLVVGQEFAGVPRRTLNVFGVYSFGEDKAWEVGGGVYYASEAWADQGNTFRLPNLVEIEALVAYRFDNKTRLQVNVKNLANRRNFTSDGSKIYPGQPASIFATLRHEF